MLCISETEEPLLKCLNSKYVIPGYICSLHGIVKCRDVGSQQSNVAKVKLTLIQ